MSNDKTTECSSQIRMEINISSNNSNNSFSSTPNNTSMDFIKNFKHEIEQTDHELDVKNSYEDQNHVKLIRVILDLQEMLENYVTNLKPNMDINIEEIKLLAKEYDCSCEITTRNKPFIKTILQRKVLDAVYEFIKELSEYQGNDYTLELDIESKMEELLKLIDQFSKTRVGNEDGKVTAIKIRQQVYGILGNRGFEDIIRSDGIYVHNLIGYASKNLNKMMNKYHKIKDVSKKNQVEAMAPKLIQDICKLFWFRLRVQEPIAEVHFFENNAKIDPDTMKGIREDDEIDQLCIGICYFPLICQDFESPNRKIYTKAKVFPLHINDEDKVVESSSISAGIGKLNNIYGFENFVILVP
ncbi:hypothetical protein C1645_777129 [Glomus cerebriforme]|uniref:Uncharacterized protein n=1 Tax=Glomus cerebriforme TaxID=658196 RepID=A0A397SXB9_9GLOM|nr:hypothetical protein C1645_777129 [Glomus cerebriforme]